jgi:hypothetical protein
MVATTGPRDWDDDEDEFEEDFFFDDEDDDDDWYDEDDEDDDGEGGITIDPDLMEEFLTNYSPSEEKEPDA